MQAAQIAHQRYESCLLGLQSNSSPNATNPDLLALGTQWTVGFSQRPCPRGNASLQDRITPGPARRRSSPQKLWTTHWR